MRKPAMTNDPSDRDTPAEEPQYDPVFLNSRREAVFIFCVWAVALLWAVPFCYLNGYIHDTDPQTMSTVWGIPAWLFWGIAVPWLVADVVTMWFCFRFMAHDDIGEAHEGADIEEEIAEMHASDEAEREGEG